MRKLIFIFLLLATPLFAIDVRLTEASLDAKSVALPPVAANYDANRVQLYLADPSWSAWNQSHGGNWFAQYDTLTGHPRRVLGGSIPWLQGNATSADLERVARDFIAANGTLIGAGNDKLRFDADSATPSRDGRIRVAAFDYVINGVPVENGRVAFAVNSGNMIYWHSTNIADVPTVTTPALSASQALSNALAYAGVSSANVEVVQQPLLKLLPRNRAAGELLAYRLVYETTFRLTGGTNTWGAYVDALTGAVIAFADVNEYVTSCTPRNSTTGRVTGGIRPAQATDAEVVRSFPFAAVDAASGAFTTTNDGTYTFTGGAVSTGLNGRYFDTNCMDCIKSDSDPQSGFQPFVSSSNGRLDLGTGGHDVVNGPGQPTQAYGNGFSTPADRNAFYHTNVARQIALKWLGLPWLLNATIPVKVNINSVCNAFWDGTALNFFKSGQVSTSSGLVTCANTGEIRDVMQHEWGHGLDSHDGRVPGYALGLGDMATGEAAADHIAIFVDHDSCIGQSFYNRLSGPFVTNPDTGEIRTCDGVRNVDELRAKRGTLTLTNVTQKCGGPPVSTSSPTVITYVGPMLNEGHCEGEIWGQTDWHLVNDFMTGRKYGTATLDANKQLATYAGDALPNGPDGSSNSAYDKDAAWDLLERLYFDSRPLVGSYAPSRNQAIGPSAYDGYLVVDDEGDGLANGTPHGAYINDAYTHHEIEEWGLPGGKPQGTDSRNCDAPPTPPTTLAQGIDGESGTPAVTIKWTAVPNATAYSVVRNERRNDVFLEVARVSGLTTVVDSGLDNGVTYNYRVVALNGSTCYASSAAGVQTITVTQPDVALRAVNVNDSNGGNGDGRLDPGEKVQLYIILNNSGLAGLTNVTGTLVSNTGGVSVTKATQKYGPIAANGSAGPLQSFAIALLANGEMCGTDAQFVLNVSSDQGCFAIPVSLPIGSDCSVYRSGFARPTSMAITNDRLSPTCGDGDLVPDPGETVQVSVSVDNVGTRNASNVTVKLMADKSYLSIANNIVALGTIAANGTETKTATFSVSVARNAPFADTATFTAVVTNSGNSIPATRTMSTPVNRDKVSRTLSYDFETGAQGWTSSSTAGWTLTNLAPTTGDLTTVWHEQYAADRCDTLTSPAIETSATSSLSFDLAYVSENSDAPYDGVNVQVSSDGGATWRTVDVAQGYAALSAGTGCMAKDEPFFSGVSPVMKRYDVDLSSYAGKVIQVRFRFSSDQLVDASPAGAWIDNIATKDVIVSVPSVPCP
jgi:hypothetical protein